MRDAVPPRKKPENRLEHPASLRRHRQIGAHLETFVAVGHICHDVVSKGYILGGSAAYSSITARNLGAQVRVVTAFSGDLDANDPLLRGIEIHGNSSPQTTTFHNVYRRGRRQQTLLGLASPLSASNVPKEWRDADMVYLCPIADEVQPDILDGFEKGIMGATPQGWLRAWDESGRVRPKRWQNAELFLPRLDVLILSQEDFAPFPDELDRYRALTRRVIVTQGPDGATLYAGKKATSFPAYPANEIDPTGAGDVFAAAFLLRFAQTQDVHESVDFANCVASFAVEAVGTQGIPTLEQVEARWKRRVSR